MGEMQQIYALAQEINELFSQIHLTATKLEEQLPKTEKAALTSQQATRILYRFNHLLSHMGLPDNVDNAISKLQQFVFIARMAEMSLAFMAMGTPYGTIMGLAGLASVTISFGDLTGYDLSRNV